MAEAEVFRTSWHSLGIIGLVTDMARRILSLPNAGLTALAEFVSNFRGVKAGPCGTLARPFCPSHPSPIFHRSLATLSSLSHPLGS